MKRILTFLVIFVMTFPYVAQSQNLKPSEQVKSAKLLGTPFTEVSLLKLKAEKSDVTLPKELKNYAILSLTSEMKCLLEGKSNPIQTLHTIEEL